MSGDISELARRLAEQAETVCRRFLSAGCREGRHWRVGDVHNSPGRSMYVRLVGPTSGRGAAGKWADAATGEHGDLIDVIRESLSLSTFGEVLEEARAFLRLPLTATQPTGHDASGDRDDYDPMSTIRRLLDASQPIEGSLAEVYLRNRDLTGIGELTALRFNPACAYRDYRSGRFTRRPAMLAIVTNLAGDVTGIQRTYLSSDGGDKARVETPRKSVGSILTHGVRFDAVDDVATTGEGIETVLSLKRAMPTMPMFAALSASNLAAIALPATLRTLYVAVDRDEAGAAALTKLSQRAIEAQIQPVALTPVRNDFNADLIEFGLDALRDNLREQLGSEEVDRYLDDRRDAWPPENAI